MRFADDFTLTDYSDPATYNPQGGQASDGTPYYLANPQQESGQSYTPYAQSPSTSSSDISLNSGGNAGAATSPSEWFGMGKDLVGTFFNIFGQPVGQRPPPVPVQQPGMPLWGWAIVGVGGIVVLGVLARSMRSSPSVAGYRKSRRSRRSRR